MSISDEIFSCENELIYNKHFQDFKYVLSDFQKSSIKTIVDGNHSLVCCGTGNGKTNSGEFAIRYFTNLGKKVIYTVPIRSLGNQKFFDFSQKFPDITFGILTGEVKAFPNAQVLIMTQEILMNYLFLSDESKKNNKNLSFQIDIENELAAVIVDECHFIMDDNRGHAWESALLMLPRNIQLIMLSATLDNPLKLASWIEKRYENDDKKVIISSTSKRIIPLIHYAYLTTSESIYKKVKDKTIQNEIKNSTNKLLLLKNKDGLFNDSSLDIVRKIKNIHENNQVYPKRPHVLNNISQYLVDNEMLPAIFYCFSRKNVERCAQEITTNLLEFDSKIPYTTRIEVEQIIRKLPNFSEYTKLPEYNILVKLLEKGIGIHHSGMISILREIVELLISKGCIKILFCTDSFSVGLNCPIKTTVFTGIKQFNGHNEQYLEPHLYAQCSGRAGRRGIDMIGNVIHCNNLFDMPSNTVYREILCGKPQKLISKFRISFNIILNVMMNGYENIDDFVSFIGKSMIKNEIDNQIISVKLEIKILEDICKSKEEQLKYSRTPLNIIKEYLECKHNKLTLHNNKRKRNDIKINDIIFEYPHCITDSISYNEYISCKQNVISKEDELATIGGCIEKQIDNICTILKIENFIDYDSNTLKYKLLSKGRIASQFSELHPLVFTENLDVLEKLSTKQLIGVLSCFTDIRVNSNYVVTNPNLIDDSYIKNTLASINLSYEKYDDYECKYDLPKTVCKYGLIYDIINETQLWSDSNNEECCKTIINTMLLNKDISLGDFSKAILKISNLVKELITICENESKIEFLLKLSQIDELILKHICTNQSLYI
jgi:antiviral helicase SKI2